MATFFEKMNGPIQQPVNNNPFSNFRQTLNMFNQFMNDYKGDPKTGFEQLMSSGRLSQEQYNTVNNMVNQFMGMMGGGKR